MPGLGITHSTHAAIVVMICAFAVCPVQATCKILQLPHSEMLTPRPSPLPRGLFHPLLVSESLDAIFYQKRGYLAEPFSQERVASS